MAGAGYKLFNTGDVLTASDVNTFLQEQVVMVFADSAARTSALSAVVAEGMVTYLQDTNSVEVFNGTAFVAVGGSSPLTTKGDLYTFSTVDARLGVGANGTTLVADSSEATGLKWAAPAGGAPASAESRVNTSQSTSSTSYTGLTTAQSVTLTTGTKVLVAISAYMIPSNASEFYASYAISGATTVSASDAFCISNDGDGLTGTQQSLSMSYVSYQTVTAGSNTFTMQFKTNGQTANYANRQIIVIDLGS